MKRLATMAVAGMIALCSSAVAQEETPPSNYQHLKELEYFVGDWVGTGKIPEDNPESPGLSFVLRLTVRWTVKKNAQVVRWDAESEGKVVMSSRGLRGWNAAAQQIKGLGFTSWGGYGESTLTQVDGKWVQKTSGADPDGTKTSHVITTTIIDQNAYVEEITARTADGKSLPDFKIEYKRVVPDK